MEGAVKMGGRRAMFYESLRRGGRGRPVSRDERQHLEKKGFLGEALEVSLDDAKYTKRVWAAQKELTSYRLLAGRERFNKNRRGPKIVSDGTLRPGPIDVDRLVDPRDRKRAEVLSRELARFGEQHRGLVKGIRAKLFGGRVLTANEAMGLMASLGLRFASATALANRGIPLVGHTSTITPQEATAQEVRRGILNWWEVAFRWGSNVESVLVPRTTHAGRSEVTDPSGSVHLRIPGGFVPDQPGWARPNSVMADLLEVGGKLARHYLWDQEDSLWFILTGAPPATPCFRAALEGGLRDDHTHYRLTISIEPWVTSESVSEIYKELQRRILDRKKLRPLRIDGLELVDFVAEQRYRGKSWPEARDAWNKSRKHARERYTMRDQKNFQRDFEATYRLLLRPCPLKGGLL